MHQKKVTSTSDSMLKQEDVNNLAAQENSCREQSLFHHNFLSLRLYKCNDVLSSLRNDSGSDKSTSNNAEKIKENQSKMDALSKKQNRMSD